MGRAATPADWERAPRLCSLAWAAWLVGMAPSTFRGLMEHDLAQRDRLSFAAPGSHRWWKTGPLYAWLNNQDAPPPPTPPPGAARLQLVEPPGSA